MLNQNTEAIILNSMLELVTIILLCDRLLKEEAGGIEKNMKDLLDKLVLMMKLMKMMKV